MPRFVLTVDELKAESELNKPSEFKLKIGIDNILVQHIYNQKEYEYDELKDEDGGYADLYCVKKVKINVENKSVRLRGDNKMIGNDENDENRI